MGIGLAFTHQRPSVVLGPACPLALVFPERMLQVNGVAPQAIKSKRVHHAVHNVAHLGTTVTIQYCNHACARFIRESNGRVRVICVGCDVWCNVLPNGLYAGHAGNADGRVCSAAFASTSASQSSAAKFSAASAKSAA